MTDSTITHRLAGGWSDLQEKRRMVVKFGGKQIALFLNRRGTVYACANRCPHEGYPLVEGSLDDE